MGLRLSSVGPCERHMKVEARFRTGFLAIYSVTIQYNVGSFLPRFVYLYLPQITLRFCSSFLHFNRKGVLGRRSVPTKEQRTMFVHLTQILILTLVGLCLSMPAFSESDETEGRWVFKKEEAGTKIYIREEPNSDLLFVKSEAVIDGSPEEVFDVLSDSKRTPEWIENLTEKRVVKYYDNDDRTIYTHVDMPWPLSDRTFVSRSKTTRKNGIINITSVSTNTPKIADDGSMRGHIHLSKFRLTPVAGGSRTHVVIEMKTDPKGMIPDWVVTKFQIDMPLDFFKNLNLQVKLIRSEAHVSSASKGILSH